MQKQLIKNKELVDYSNDYYIYWKANQKGMFWIKVKQKKKVNGTDLGVQKYSHVHGHDI